MRLLKTLMILGTLSLSANVFAADVDTTPTLQNEEVEEFGGEEYLVYMRKMNAIQKIITKSNPAAEEFIQAMNEEQGGSYVNIPSSPDKKTVVYTYTTFESFLASDIPDSRKNMILSDYGLSIDSDFKVAPPLGGSIMVDDYLSIMAEERTADQYSNEPQSAMVNLDDLFIENGMEELIAEEPNANYQTANVSPAAGFGFISQANAGFIDSVIKDKSKIKTESKTQEFTADSLLSDLSRSNQYAELKVEGDLGVNGSVYIGITYKERTLAGIPYKWYFENITATVKVKVDQPEPAKIIGTVNYAQSGNLISDIELFKMGLKFSGWIGPVQYAIEFDLASQLGMKYYFILEGLLQGDLVGKGEYYGSFRCTKDDCESIAETNSLEFESSNPTGHATAEIGIYPWITAEARIGLEAMFLDIAEAKVKAGAAAKLTAWGYIGNDCRIDGTSSPALDTAWMIYVNSLYWGYTEIDTKFTHADRNPLRIAGKVGHDFWRDFSPTEKSLFGIDGDTYSATRLEVIQGDTKWLDPIVEFPETVYVGEPLDGNLRFRPCLPESIMQNTVNAKVDYGDMTDSFWLTDSTPLLKAYPYVNAEEIQLRSWADRIGAVKLKGGGYSVPLSVTEPNFGLGGGLNKSTIPQNSIVLD